MKRNEIKAMLGSVTDSKLRGVIKQLGLPVADNTVYTAEQVAMIRDAFTISSDEKPTAEPTAEPGKLINQSRQQANAALNAAMDAALMTESQHLERAAKQGAGLAGRAMKVKVEAFAEASNQLETKFLKVLDQFDQAYAQAAGTLEQEVAVDDFFDQFEPRLNTPMLGGIPKLDQKSLTNGQSGLTTFDQPSSGSTSTDSNPDHYESTD